MADLSKIPLFRMVHIENIKHILSYGITHKESPHANPHFVPIGDSSIITTRNSFVLENGNTIGDYIPFYFASRTPMLYVIQNGFNGVKTNNPENIIYCVTSVQKIVDLGVDFIFTDGHAIDRLSSQYSNVDIVNIDNFVDWKAIKAKFWIDENDLDLKRRKEAEFMVSGDIPYASLLGFIVYNQKAKERLLSIGVPEEKIKINTTYYF